MHGHALWRPWQQLLRVVVLVWSEAQGAVPQSAPCLGQEAGREGEGEAMSEDVKKSEAWKKLIAPLIPVPVEEAEEIAREIMGPGRTICPACGRSILLYARRRAYPVASENHHARIEEVHSELIAFDTRMIWATERRWVCDKTRAAS